MLDVDGFILPLQLGAPEFIESSILPLWNPLEYAEPLSAVDRLEFTGTDASLSSLPFLTP